MIKRKKRSMASYHEKETVFRLGELYCGPGGLACGAVVSMTATVNAKISPEEAANAKLTW